MKQPRFASLTESAEAGLAQSLHLIIWFQWSDEVGIFALLQLESYLLTHAISASSIFTIFSCQILKNDSAPFSVCERLPMKEDC